jgi:hypothetical protein
MEYLMTTKDNALRMAIEAIENYGEMLSAIGVLIDNTIPNKAIEACKAALSDETVTLPNIDYDSDMDRYYIPMPAGWEMQTKGKGSSFRLCNTKTHERFHILDERLQPVLEQMAREMHEVFIA